MKSGGFFSHTQIILISSSVILTHNTKQWFLTKRAENKNGRLNNKMEQKQGMNGKKTIKKNIIYSPSCVFIRNVSLAIKNKQNKKAVKLKKNKLAK